MRPIHETSFPEVRIHWWETGREVDEELWTQCSLGQLDVGDIFRIRKPDGTLHTDDRGKAQWRVTEIPTVPCEPHP